jgi:DNA topoisomerase III
MQAHVKKHLFDCAKGCSHIVLWLDCDREGENICFEVLDCAVPALSHARPSRFIWRARFSAISAPEITSAMANLGEPNENEALAVDARQELDLKVFEHSQFPPVPAVPGCL